MYGPDSYLYETNMALLATLADAELSDAELIAQLAPGTSALAELSGWLVAALGRGLATVGAWLTPPVETVEQSGAYWMYPPLY